MRDRLRPAVLARNVLLPPVLAGAAVSCVLAALALTIASGSRADGRAPLARAPTHGEQLAIGLSLELAVTARPPGAAGPAGVSWPARERPSAELVRLAAKAPEPATLATPVAGTVGGCGTFGCTRPGHLHNGVDFLAAAGTPVHAAASGRVALVQSPAQSGGYGNFVCLQHRPALATCYAHLSAVAARMRVGAAVTRGQVLGLVGATGSASTPHLHFEVRRGPAACQRCAVDPLTLLPRRAGELRPEAIAGDAPTLASASPPLAAAALAPPAVGPAPGTGGAPSAPAPHGAASAPAPAGDASAPEDTTTFVQAKPRRPQQIHLPPEPERAPVAPPPAPAPASSGPVPATDPAAAAPGPVGPAATPPG